MLRCEGLLFLLKWVRFNFVEEFLLYLFITMSLVSVFMSWGPSVSDMECLI